MFEPLRDWIPLLTTTDADVAISRTFFEASFLMTEDFFIFTKIERFEIQRMFFLSKQSNSSSNCDCQDARSCCAWVQWTWLSVGDFPGRCYQVHCPPPKKMNEMFFWIFGYHGKSDFVALCVEHAKSDKIALYVGRSPGRSLTPHQADGGGR